MQIGLDSVISTPMKQKEYIIFPSYIVAHIVSLPLTNWLNLLTAYAIYEFVEINSDPFRYLHCLKN